MVECVLFNRPSYSLYWSLCGESVMILTFSKQQSHFIVEVSTFTVRRYQVTCECSFAAHNGIRNLIYTTSWHLVTFFQARYLILNSLNHYSLIICFLRCGGSNPNSPCYVSSCIPQLVKFVQQL